MSLLLVALIYRSVMGRNVWELNELKRAKTSKANSEYRQRLEGLRDKWVMGRATHRAEWAWLTVVHIQVQGLCKGDKTRVA